MGNIFNKKSETVNYNSHYILNKYLKRYENLSESYKKLYQLTTNGNNECTVSLWINILLTQPITTYVQNIAKEDFSEQNYQRLNDNIKIIFDNFVKVFSSDDLQSVPSTNYDHKDFKKHIDAINDGIGSRGPENSSINTTIPLTLRNILLILKEEVKNFKKEVEDYGKSYGDTNAVYKLFIDTEWRTKNYNDFIDNEISVFIMRIDTKIREIESAITFLKITKDLIQDGIDQNKSNGKQILSNLAYIFKDYRVKHNINSN